MRHLVMLVEVDEDLTAGRSSVEVASAILDMEHDYAPELVRTQWRPVGDADPVADDPGPQPPDKPEPEDPAQPDREIEAMATIVRSLTPLDPAGRAAVVNYLFDRYSATDARG